MSLEILVELYDACRRTMRAHNGRDSMLLPPSGTDEGKWRGRPSSARDRRALPGTTICGVLQG